MKESSERVTKFSPDTFGGGGGGGVLSERRAISLSVGGENTKLVALLVIQCNGNRYRSSLLVLFTTSTNADKSIIFPSIHNRFVGFRKDKPL
ncbi:unnamed protein product [Nippostrongylus brasiliensis]|uniref:Uncharacterized protein n=1 Tax=Nippostrongylus brasiliensis TaxID=27835 RepID=A0A0N4XC70_NIPBR|nr:unnamed protein product [Nippostrongylus brasiliensis]